MVIKDIATYEEKIKEKLQILKYDPKKHKDLRSCYTQLLNREDINKAISGIITDSNVLEEVVNIIEAYEFLKEHEEEMLEVLKKENSLTNTPKALDEILIYYDDEEKCYRVLKKQKASSQYMLIQESEKIDVEENFYIVNIDGTNVLCNMKGEVLTYLGPKDEVEKVTNKIIRVLNTESGHGERTYFMLERGKNGKFKQLANLDLWVERDKWIEMILLSNEVSDVNKDYIFNYVFSGKKIKYGKEDIKEKKIVNNFVYVVYENGNVCYFTLDGKKIISTDSDKYCYIGNLFPTKDGKKNIITVGQYDENLNKIYSYYDLDKRKCFKQKFPCVYNWADYCGIVFTPNASIIKEDETLIEYDQNDCFPITKNAPYSFPREMIARSIKKWKNDVYIVEFIPYYPSNFPNYVYDVENFDGLFSTVNKVCYALISDIDTKPRRISDYFLEYKMISEDNDRIFIVPWKSPHSYNILDITGKQLNIIREQEDIRNQIATPKKNKENMNKISVNDSAFLLPECKNVKIQKNNNFIATHQQTIVDKFSSVAKIDSQEDSFDFSRFQGEFPTIKINKIKKFFEDGTVVVELYDKTQLLVLVSPEGRPIYYQKATPITLDNVGNIIWEVYYGNSTRKILTDKKGKILIGFSNEIIPSNEGYYIVKKEGTYQLYDFKGETVTIATDKQEWVTKYYVDECGAVLSTKEKLLITNAGYKYLLDDDGDITIKENKNYAKILRKANLLGKIEN